uniref:Uncharacterized protein n=1 Tax=Rhodococcus sp. NS1 TaxID=402236 RepID=A0A097SQ11_9NOCA|nr:hypothetical protein LRS1606.175 [Rhodococcus sp. NS1]
MESQHRLSPIRQLIVGTVSERIDTITQSGGPVAPHTTKQAALAPTDGALVLPSRNRPAETYHSTAVVEGKHRYRHQRADHARHSWRSRRKPLGWPMELRAVHARNWLPNATRQWSSSKAAPH